MSKQDIFSGIKKDKTVPTHYTIRESLVNKIKNDSKKTGLSESKVVDMILENYYKKS
jgi:hypothetical protein